MAFENLSDKLQMTLRRVVGKGKLSENDIDNMMKEIRLSLLEADVNYQVVRSFTNEIKQEAIGKRILQGLNPGQQVLKIVNEKLIELMGSKTYDILMNPAGITTIMMVGLQGAGKTTHVGKLGKYLREKFNKKPLFIAADIYRPAAIEQLKTLGNNLDIPVFDMGTLVKPEDIVKQGIEKAKKDNCDLIIIDTAGRLHIDDDMMEELVKVKAVASPDEILLTVDAMTGQDAVNVAQVFNEKLKITGSILTKLDGDTRGGAALSIKKITDVPIKFMGVGEKLSDIEVFHPERMASRILGMGDMLSLIEKATENIDEEDAMKLAEKMAEGKFNFNDFRSQLKMVKRMGSLKSLLGMIPGLGSQLKNIDIDDKQFNNIEAIINSMTKFERKNPEAIRMSSSRKRRISEGSGRTMNEVNGLIKRFDEMKTQMKSMMGMDPSKMESMMNQMQSGQMPGMMGNQFGQPKKKKKKKGIYKY